MTLTTATTLLQQSCSECHADTVLEAVPCVDGHGECHEFTCLRCGAAFLIGAPVDDDDAVRVASVA